MHVKCYNNHSNVTRILSPVGSLGILFWCVKFKLKMLLTKECPKVTKPVSCYEFSLEIAGNKQISIGRHFSGISFSENVK